VVASLLVVVIGDAMVAQGQVRISHIQMAIAADQASQKSTQVEVAELAAPDRVVAQGIADGQVANGSVTNLPQVPLDVPLPAPQTAPSAAAAISSTTDTTPPTTAR
jgi:hypothetical protein